MSTKMKIYKGSTMKGTLDLRLEDGCDANKINPFVIEAGSLIEVIFQGTTAQVILSTANVGEITIVDDQLSTISFIGSVAKSNLLKTNSNAAIDVRVTQGISGEVFIFEELKIAEIIEIANK